MKPPEALYDQLFLFRRSYPLRARMPRGVFGLASMIDVVVLLFLFLLCNSPFVLQPGISIDLPAAPFTDGAPYASIVVTISQEGLIFLNDEKTSLARLEAALTRALHREGTATLLVEADAKVPYDSLVQIYNMARTQGVKEVILATRGLPP